MHKIDFFPSIPEKIITGPDMTTTIMEIRCYYMKLSIDYFRPVLAVVM